jgi:tetratricopeptide (TPR) repeat protein
MKKTHALMEIKESMLRRIGCLMGVLLTVVFLTACGTTETQESGENPEPGKQLQPEIVEGLKLLREKNYEAAMSTVFALVVKEPNNPDALSTMGLIYVKQGRLMDASKLAKRSLKVDPNQSLPYSVLARAKFQTSGFEEALNLARQALRIDPKSFRAYKLIGEIYLRQGLTKDALTVFKEAVKLEPNDPDILNLLGSGYIKNNQHDNALPVLLKAQEIDPNLAGVHFNLALVYAKSQNGKKAISHIETAEHLYTQIENKPWMAKTRDIKRLLAKKFGFTADQITGKS